jgi:thiol-disulfide isomerase/thioredoxin
MTSVEPSSAGRRPALGAPLKAALVLVVGIGVAAALYVIVSALIKPGAQGGLGGLNHGTMAKLQVLADPVPEPAVVFVGDQAKPVRLADFKGRAVVLNLWATWCAPCVKEMPTLAALQQAEAGKPVKVVPVSMDTAGETDKAKAFIAGHAPLPFYQDAKYAFMTGMKPALVGFPTTVLIDKAGMERAIYAGDTDWNSPEARAVVERLAGL